MTPVASDPSGTQFKSSHQQNFTKNIEEIEIKKKKPGIAYSFKNLMLNHTTLAWEQRLELLLKLNLNLNSQTIIVLVPKCDLKQLAFISYC